MAVAMLPRCAAVKPLSQLPLSIAFRSSPWAESAYAVINAERGRHVQRQRHDCGWADGGNRGIENLGQEGFCRTGERAQTAESGQDLDGRRGEEWLTGVTESVTPAEPTPKVTVTCSRARAACR